MRVLEPFFSKNHDPEYPRLRASAANILQQERQLQVRIEYEKPENIYIEREKGKEREREREREKKKNNIKKLNAYFFEKKSLLDRK